MILVIDNYDSFTYNIVQGLGALGAEVEVVRNDAIDIAGIAAKAPQAILFSPVLALTQLEGYRMA